MRKMMVVAVREYLAAVRTKAFIITLVAMPVLFAGSIAAQILVKDRVDTDDKRIAVLDRTGRLYDSLEAAAKERNETEIFEGTGPARRKIRPAFLMERVVDAPDDPAAAILQLSDRVRAEEISAFVIVDRGAIEPGGDEAEEAIAYYSNTPTYRDLRGWLAQQLNASIRRIRLQAANLDAELVDLAMRAVPVANLGLVQLDEQGNVTEAKETDERANIIVPLALMMLMYMTIMLGASPLMQSVLEEKMQRIAEVLLGSVPPFQLMAGKLLGGVGVSLTLFAFYIVGAFVAANRAGYGDLFPTHVVWWFALFQALAVLMFGSLFVAIGAAVSDLKEAQSLMLPVVMLVVSPMFVWFNVVQQPASSFATTLSLIPPATPMLMVIRLAVPPGIPLWQPLLGVVLMLLTTVVCVFAAGRVFRVGILMQGKGAKIGQMIRWVIRG